MFLVSEKYKIGLTTHKKSSEKTDKSHMPFLNIQLYIFVPLHGIRANIDKADHTK